MLLFLDVKYCLSSSLDTETQSRLSLALADNGATRVPLEEATHVITNSIQFEGWQTVADGVFVVTEKWVIHSILTSKYQQPQFYSADPSKIFSGVIACEAELPPSDIEVLSAGITALGGQWRMALTHDVTHLFALSPGTQKYETALHFQDKTNVKVVLPHWFDDAVRLGMGFLPTSEYEWPEPRLLKAVPDGEADEGKKVKMAANKKVLFKTALWSLGKDIPPSQANQRDIWHERRILLSPSLGLATGRREAVEAGIKRSNGIIVEYSAEGGDGNEEEEVRKVQEADILITRYRSGVAYVKAVKAHKTIGTLAWLFHVESTGVLSRPLDQLLHYPIPKKSIEGFSAHEITITNYTGEAREYLKKLISAMGAQFTPSMSGRNTVLIAAYLSGNKATKARNWSIPIVNHTWLEDCFVQWRNLTVGLEKYIVFPPGVDFSQMLGERGVGRAVLDEVDLELVEEEEEEAEEAEVVPAAKEDGPAPVGTNNSARDANEVEDAVGLFDGDDDIFINAEDDRNTLASPQPRPKSASKIIPKTTPKTTPKTIPKSTPKTTPRVTTPKRPSKSRHLSLSSDDEPVIVARKLQVRSPATPRKRPDSPVDEVTSRNKRAGKLVRREIPVSSPIASPSRPKMQLRSTVSPTKRPESPTSEDEMVVSGSKRISKRVQSSDTRRQLSPPSSPIDSPSNRRRGRGLIFDEESDRDPGTSKKRKALPRSEDEHESDLVIPHKAKVIKKMKAKTARAHFDSDDDEILAPPSKAITAPGPKDKSGVSTKGKAKAIVEATPSVASPVRAGTSPRKLPSVVITTSPNGPPVRTESVIANAAETSSVPKKRGRPNLSKASSPPADPSSTVRISGKRTAAAKAIQKLHDEIMPDVMNYQQEMRNRMKGKGKERMLDKSVDDQSVVSGKSKGKKRASDVHSALSSDVEARDVKKRKSGQGGGRNKATTTDDDGGEQSEDDTVRKQARKTEPTAKRMGETSLGAKNRKSDPGTKSIRLMTTQVHLADDVLKVLTKLGVKVTTKPTECTHLLASHLVRTEKFLCALAAAPFILSEEWALESAAAKRLLPEDDYLLRDPENEKKYNFRLADAMRRAKDVGGRLFANQTFYVTPKVPVDPKLLKNVVISGGGQFSTQTPTLRILSANDNRHVVSCEADASIWRPLAQHQYPIYTHELLLTGTLKQDVDWEDAAYRLLVQSSR